jgi:apolipoprotein N-acyltransferase
MARLRAIENHRYLLRATNDGVTTVIDPYGRVREELPRHRQMVLPAHFNFETQRTFYTAHGDVFAWLCVASAALMLAGISLKHHKPPSLGNGPLATDGGQQPSRSKRD